MKNASEPSFLYLMEVDGRTLGAPPPKLTIQEKLDWMKEQTARQELCAENKERCRQVLKEKQGKQR